MGATRTGRAHKIGRIATRLRADGGFALPMTLLMLLAAFAVVTVGVVSTIDVQRGTVRDQDTKSSIQLAQTGVNDALLHFNRIASSPTNRCSPVSGTTPDVNGWCQQMTTTDPAGGSYSWQVRLCDSTGACPPASNKPIASLEIVGVGTDSNGNTTRRVDVKAHSVSGTQVFAEYQVKAGDGITLDSNARIHAGTATNGDLVLNSNAKQCGQASVGVGHEMRTASSNSYFTDPNCTSPATTVAEQQIFLPPVNQGDAATVNDDGRLFNQDLISGSKSRACWNGLDGNGAASANCGTRHLDIQQNTTVTLSGSIYSFCKLTMSSNTSLFISSGHSAVIYFDSPEHCGYPSGTTQLDMASNTRISSNDGSPVQLMFVGSPTLRTQINMNSNTDINAACVQNFVVYAPLSDINMNSNSTYCGGLAAKTLHLDSNADIRTNGASQSFIVPPAAPHFTVDRFVECTATTASPANSGC